MDVLKLVRSKFVDPGNNFNADMARFSRLKREGRLMPPTPSQWLMVNNAGRQCLSNVQTADFTATWQHTLKQAIETSGAHVYFVLDSPPPAQRTVKEILVIRTIGNDLNDPSSMQMIFLRLEWDAAQQIFTHD